ncbi:glutamate--cysteine ligase [Actinoplanes sp. DH11]|uniref:carboxylate-amine ligase n=1 Tax=Actinoplanes sp. DH11 TaxID=2857011 RepID=UPI001E5D728E|nr:glutamate--cysteine ligase [Actinoplanes sp. DH11]
MTSTITSPLTVVGDPARPALTVGVEEEFLLLDPVTGANVPVAEQVRTALPRRLREQSRQEMRRSMMELVTGVCTDLGDVRAQLVALRQSAACVAESAGARLVAVGATPVGEPDRGVPSGPRYQDIVDRYGPVALDPAVCGMHVHVGVPDRDLAVQVCNHLQVWLPVIQAMTSNSPFFEGADTGHASWRSVQLRRWPGVAPTPHFSTADEYDATVTDLLESGVLLDEATVYWYARLSASYPTVEVRIGDVCTDVDDAVLVTALIRAAVATAVADIVDGRPAPVLRECVVDAAHWRAAREGLGGELIDLRLGHARPAWELVDEFFATVSPALLATGDLTLVVDGLARLRHTGDGAARQRSLHQGTGSLPAVLTTLAEWTRAG